MSSVQLGPYRIDDVNIHGSGTPLSEAQADALEDMIRRSLLGLKSFDPTGREGLTARVWARRGDDARHVELLLRLEVPEALRAGIRGGVVEAHVGWPADPASDDAGAWEEASARAAKAVEAQFRLASGGDGVVAELLAADDPHLNVVAMEWLRSEGDRVRLQLVINMLGHTEPQVARLAVEIIGELGGPEHASALVRHVRLADPGHAHRTYEALASLGGVDAEGFLRFAARNEDDPQRQHTARVALDRLMRSTGASNQRADILRGHRP
ncbi:MAG: HEAT repeat domain-containing protein [Nannocystaceae bacterium]